MQSAIPDIFGTARGTTGHYVPEIDGGRDPLFSTLLDETAARTQTHAEADERAAYDEPAEADGDIEESEGDDDRPARDEHSRSASTTADGGPAPGKGEAEGKAKNAAGPADAAAGDVPAAGDANKPITVEAAQIRFANAEGAVPIPGTAEPAVIAALAAEAGGAPAAAVAGAAAGAKADPLKAAEEFVLGRRAHLLAANAAHAETARQISHGGKAGTGKAATGAQGAGPAAAAKGAGSAANAHAGEANASLARTADAATAADRPAPVSAAPAPTTGSPAVPQGPANGAPQFFEAVKTAAGERPAVDQTAMAGADRQAMQASAAKAAANARPAPNAPLPRPAEQLSVQIRNAGTNGNDRISVRLTPASLGQVEVKLELAPDKTVHAIVTAEKPETLDMLERDARVLQRALEDAGLKTGSGSLTFAHRDTGGESGRSDGNGGADGHAGAGDGETGDDTGLAEASAPSRRHHDGVLDVEI